MIEPSGIVAIVAIGACFTLLTSEPLVGLEVSFLNLWYNLKQFVRQERDVGQVGKRSVQWMDGGKEKVTFSKKSEWVVDLGLVLLYSLFMTGCFFIFITPRVWGYHKLTSWADLASIILVVLVSPSVSFVLHNLTRTLLIFALSSLLGCGLTSVSSVAFLFYSYTYFEIETAPDITRAFSPAQQILVFTISFLFVSILGAIAGDYMAEKTRKGEKTLTLRCPKCGTWNAQDTIYCSHCGSNLHGEYNTADKRMH